MPRQLWRRPAFWLGVILCAGAAYRLLFLLRPLDWVVSVCTADDYYYYLSTAWNVAHGHGSSADGGLTRHNGYQPLFLALLLPATALGATKTVLFWYGLAVQSISGLVAAWLSWRVTARLGNAWVALCPAVALALNLYFVRASLWGFETPLAIACTLAVVDATLGRAPAWRVGLLAGLAVMARVDVVLLAPALALHLASARRWRDLAVTAGVALLACLPWILWSSAAFGSPLPQSGAAKILAGNPAGFWNGFAAFCAQLPPLLVADRLAHLLPQQVAFTLGVLVLAASLSRPRHGGWIAWAALALFATYALLTDTSLAWQFTRYTAPAVALLGIVLFSRPRPAGRWARASWAAPLLLALLAIGLDTGHVRWAMRTGPIPTYHGLCQREVPAILSRIVGPGDLVGCFDSGSAGYFSNVPVVNLDGLVNAEIVNLLRDPDPAAGTWRERYLRYFEARGITILVGGTAYSWIRTIPEAAQWERLHASLQSSDGGEILIVRVPARDGAP